jgi:hypothetical protein
MTADLRRYRISPLVRGTLLLLYLALTLPLPALARTTAAPVPPELLGAGLVIGLLLLYAALSEQVTCDATGIRVAHPTWCAWLFRRNWSLAWGEITAIRERTTGQGGRVHYLLDGAGNGYLLPMRVAGFADLTRRLQAETGLSTDSIRPLAQAWMYLILLGMTLLLLLVDLWVYTVALPGSPQLP